MVPSALRINPWETSDFKAEVRIHRALFGLYRDPEPTKRDLQEDQEDNTFLLFS